MALTNLNNKYLPAEERTPITESVNNLRGLTRPIAVNLTADERRRYGSINELNKGIVNKAKDFNDRLPELSSPDVDWREFDRDYEMRNFFETTLQAIYAITRDLENAKILYDYDNYTAANADYAYTTYKVKSGDTGYQNKLDEMKQFYERSSAPKDAPEP